MCLGIVGYGGMGSWHGNIVKDIDGLTVKGVYDIKPERGEIAKERGFQSYHSLEELLSDEEIDIVLVSTPNDLHKPIAIQAMRAGKNVVSEKPVTLSSADLAEMIRVSEETGVLFTVHQNRRWDEDFLTMKKIYDENLLGGVFRIESRVHGSRGIPGDWRQEKEHGGGMVLDWGVHLLDQILEHIPAPEQLEGTPQMLITSLDYSNYTGRIAVGRVHRGTLKEGMNITICHRDGSKEKTKIKELHTFTGMGRQRIQEVSSGDICAIVGLEHFEIGDTICDFENPEPLPTISIDEQILYEPSYQ